jgi:hypothetical protein
MANGAAVTLQLVPEPSTEAAAGKPGATPTSTAIETTKIGSVVADAAEIIAVALAEYEAGGAMTVATRTASAERLGRVAELFLSTFGELPNLAVTARREGKRVLHQRHGATLLQHCGAAPEAAINELLDHVVAIASTVARDEMAFRAN